MAMTIGDANDVQAVLRHLYRPAGEWSDPDQLQHVHTAAQRLADRSSAQLAAGQRAGDLDAGRIAAQNIAS